jgi:hypothetical protein
VIEVGSAPLVPGEWILVGHRTHVQRETMSLRLPALVHGEQARVIDVKALDGMVKFEAAQAEPLQRVPRDGLEVGLTGVQGSEGDSLREP